MATETGPTPAVDEPRAQRIGLLGGTFDPPHNAHLALARTALSALNLDELRWIPAGQPWQKTRHVTAAEHREAMVRAAIADEPRYVLDRSELQRSGPSYMIDTVQDLQARVAPGVAAQWFLIIGADQAAGLHTWYRYRDLLQRVTLAVAGRPGARAAVHADVQQSAQVSLPMLLQETSATEIRRRVAGGEPIMAMVPPAVARYIAQHQLYLERTP